jgi:peroxiredoxin family protein
MDKIIKKVSIMCFQDEMCRVFNALMTAISLLREGAGVTLFFGSRGVNAVHKVKMYDLKCIPDAPADEGEAVRKKMEEMELPTIEDLFVMLIAEGATILACPLNMPLFGMAPADLIEGVRPADPSVYYKEVVLQADMNLSF